MNNFTNNSSLDKINAMMHLLKNITSPKTSSNVIHNDFDSIINGEQINMLKATVPYMQEDIQSKMAILIKFLELTNTINLFKNNSIKDIPEFNKINHSKLELLSILRNKASNKNKELLDNIIKIYNIKMLFDNINNPYLPANVNQAATENTSDVELEKEDLIAQLKQLLQQ